MKAIVLATILLIQVVLIGQFGHSQKPVEVPSKPIVNNNSGTNGGSSSSVSYSSSTTTVVVESKSSYSSLNGVATPSKDKPLGSIDIGGVSFQTFTDALGRPFYVSQSGNIKYYDPSNPSSANFPTSLQSTALYDLKKRRYFVDSQGNAFYMDAKTGFPFYIDNNNKEYFVDSYGRIFFRDSLGRYYYIDGSTGRQIYFLPPSKVKEIPGLNLADIPKPGTTPNIPPVATSTSSSAGTTTGTKPPIVVVVRPLPSPIVGIPIPVPSTRPTHPSKPIPVPVPSPTPTTGSGTTTGSSNVNTNNNNGQSSIYVNTPSSSNAQVINPNGLAGGPFVDSQGRVYYKDQNGMATYQNSQTGESYYIDPVTGQCFMLNQLGEHITCPSNLQTVGNSATAANSASTSRKKTYYYNDGKIYMVNEDGSLVETNTPLAQSNQIVQATSSSSSSNIAPLKGYTVIDGKMYWIDENTGGTVPFSQAPTNNRS